MVFIPDQGRLVVASFWQNSLSWMEPGSEAEVIFNAVPGHVFTGKQAYVLPGLGESDVQSSGQLASSQQLETHDRALVMIELDESLTEYNLPRGVAGMAIVYTDHFSHVVVMRKVLLRILGWLNYVFPIKSRVRD